MFVTGFVIFLSIILVLAKLPRLWMLRALRFDIAIDLAVSVIVLAIHWGSFSGVIAATFAGLLTSVATSTAKRAFGHVRKGQYFPGWFTLRVEDLR